MNTSQIKVYEERNTEYKLGDELHFHIPSTVLMINPLETFLKFNINVGTVGAGTLTAGKVDPDHYYKLILNSKIGAAAFIKELSILSGSGGNRVLEQFDNYNRLSRAICGVSDNSTESNKRKLFEGAGELVAGENAQMYSGGSAAVLNNRKIEVCVPIKLSGLFNNNQPLPSYLLGGLHVRILLENDLYKVMSSASIGYGWNKSAKTHQSIQAGFVNDTGFRTDPATVLNGGAQATLTLANTLAEANTAANAPPAGDQYVIGSLAYVEGVSATNIHAHPFAIGQTIVISGLYTVVGAVAVADVEVDITAIANAAGRLQISFAAVNLAANTGNAARIYIKPPATNPIPNLSDMELVVGTVSPTGKQIQALESAVSSKGYAFEFQTYRDYMVNNAANEIVSSNTIIANLRRAKAIMTGWEVLEGNKKIQEDGLTGYVSSRQNPTDYQYIINNLLTPNQRVSLSQYIRDRNTPAGWSAIHLKELEDAFEALNIEVENLTEVDDNLLICRALSRYGHTFNMAASQGETRLNINFASQTEPILLHNWVGHMRTIVVNRGGVSVMM